MYWFTYLLFAFAAWAFPSKRFSLPFSIILILFLTLYIGLRFEVGGDWFNYIEYVKAAQSASLEDFISWGDPGFNFLVWNSTHLNFGIYGANLVSAFLFSLGLVFFVQRLPNPFLALAVASPYLITVVAMGYTRQSVAMGLVFWALSFFNNSRLLPCLFILLSAALFHLSSTFVLFLLFPAWWKAFPTKRPYLAVAFFLPILLGAFLLTPTRLANVTVNYLASTTSSSGAWYRLFLLCVPSYLLLKYRRLFSFRYPSVNYLSTFALASLFGALILALAPSFSTLIDRVSIYFFPVQLFVLSAFPSVRLFSLSRNSWILIILIYSLLLQLLWFSFSPYSSDWLPYQNILMVQ